MKKVIKILSLLLTLAMLTSAFTGCNNPLEGKDDGTWNTLLVSPDKYDESKYTPGQEVPALSTNEKLVENNYFTMGWNDTNKSVVLVSKATGKKWGTNPIDYYELTPEQQNHEMIHSPLTVQFATNSKPTEITAGGSVKNAGRVSSELIENGISATYYFDEYFFSLTLDYYLEGDSVKVRLDPSKIVEAGINYVVSVGISPFMCSAKNTQAGNKDSYLVVPSGSGALMYADQRSSGTARAISSYVYGEDALVEYYQDADNNSDASMPFFGAKDGATATVGIIENGAEHAMIKAEAGNSKTGVSEAYAFVDVRGHDLIYLKEVWRNKYSEKISDIEPIVVGYYTLSGENANYTGIAKKYQKYLIDNENLTKEGTNKLLNVEILGSYLEDELFLGIPYKKGKALTTYKQAETILTELKELTGGSLSATMKGYGEGGLNGSKIAGNYKLTGVAGNEKELKSFITFADSAGIETFFNFDVINFSKNGAGVSIGNNAAISNSGFTARTRQFKANTRNRLEEDGGGVVGVLLSRRDIESVVNKTADFASKYGISNIAFDTLGNTAYSDYNENASYPSKLGIDTDVKKYIDALQQKNNKILLNSAYSYAATEADVLTGCPINSNNDRSIDVDVPLYQIVFQGYKENYITPINYASDRRLAFLKAIESGSGISYILINDYDIELRKQYENIFGASVYSDNKEVIKNYIDEAKDFLVSVASAEIKNHTILSDNVTKTVFEGGKTVYVNMSDKAVTTEVGVIAANDFLVK